MRTRSGWLATLVPLLLLAVSQPQGAQAQTATLKRSVENITQGPLDIALAPGVAAYTAYRSITAPEASTGERMSLALVGGPWAAIMDGGGGFFRTWAGVIELPVAIGLFVTEIFTDTEPGPLFDLQGQHALVDRPSDIYDLKLGVFYVSNPSVE